MNVRYGDLDRPSCALSCLLLLLFLFLDLLFDHFVQSAANSLGVYALLQQNRTLDPKLGNVAS